MACFTKKRSSRFAQFNELVENPILRTECTVMHVKSSTLFYLVLAMLLDLMVNQTPQLVLSVAESLLRGVAK